LVNPAPLSQMEQCGRITPERVAGMPRIGWPPSSGIGGRIGPEYARGRLTTGRSPMGNAERGIFFLPDHLLHKEHVKRIGPAVHVFLWLWRHVGADTRRPFGGLIFDGHKFNISDLVQNLGISNTTIRAHLKLLADAGYIYKISAGRGGLRAAICLWHPNDESGSSRLLKNTLPGSFHIKICTA
jgi:DNA-binding transcriptional ArsR family regulator